MRTYEDVKIALKTYQDELANEASSKQPHWVVIGGNMCITRKGASTLYILGKGSPVPMIKTTAESNLRKFQDKCGDNIELKMVEYTSWLNEEIKECEHLIACMQKTLSGDSQETPGSQSISSLSSDAESSPICGPQDTVHRDIIMVCSSCPYGINTCMACKFCVGVDPSRIPWQIICSAPIEKEPEGEKD